MQKYAEMEKYTDGKIHTYKNVGETGAHSVRGVLLKTIQIQCRHFAALQNIFVSAWQELSEV